MYYFGGSQDGTKIQSGLYGIDIGYNLKLPIVTIRPMLGIGDFIVAATGESPVAGVDRKSSLYLQPGVTAILPLGLFFVGADANALIVTDEIRTGGHAGVGVALTIHGQVGVRF